MTMNMSEISKWKRMQIGMMILLVATAAVPASGKTITKGEFGFVNVADTTDHQFSLFGSMPAINNDGAVAFNTPEGVFKSDDGTSTTIASDAGDVLALFGDSVVVNSDGVVGFSCRVTADGDTIVAT